jgi:hypothetical protein
MAYISKRSERYSCAVKVQGVREYATFDTEREAIIWGAETELRILRGDSASSRKDCLLPDCGIKLYLQLKTFM